MGHYTIKDGKMAHVETKREIKTPSKKQKGNRYASPSEKETIRNTSQKEDADQ